MDERITKAVQNYVDSVIKPVKSEISNCETDLKFIEQPKQLVDYPRILRALNALREKVSKMSVSFDIDKPKASLQAEFENKIIAHGEKEIAINDKYTKMVEQKEQEIVQAARAHNQKLRDELNADNQVFIDLENKRKQLELYSDEVMELCARYDITTSDITITNASFTIDELNEVYDAYIGYMNKVGDKKNYIQKFRDIVHDNPYVEAGVLLLLMIIAFTPLLDIISIGFFSLIVVMQLKARKKMESYSILLGLIYNIQPLNMGFKANVDESQLVDEVVDEDDDPELNKIADKWESELEILDVEDPMIEAEALLSEYRSSVEEIKKIFKDKEKEVLDFRDTVIKTIHDMLSKLTAEYEDKKSKMIKLGDEINPSPIFNTNFKLGIEEGVLEKEYDIGLQNIILQPSHSPDFKMFLNVLLANALCNVKAGNLTVYVYDPNDFGQDVVGFYNADLEQHFIFKNDSLDETIKTLKLYAESNMKTMGGLTINEYNTEAVAVGKTTKDYKLLLVLSQPKTIEESEALKSFMSYSAKLGVFVWAVMKTVLPNTKIFRVPYEGVMCPYKVDLKTFSRNVGRVLAKAIKDNKIDGLNWLTYKDIANKDEDIWKGTTDKYIDIDLGFWEGDPSQYDGYTLGHDGDVHALLVGGTGAGKSVCMNQLIINVARKYSPRALELWLCDYKGSEFSAYLSTPEHPKVLPHLKACLCTSDGEYAGSLYAALRAESERRYAHLQKAGCKDMLEYNGYIRKGMIYEYTDENGELVYIKSAEDLETQKGYRRLGIDDLFSRILFVNDEFQVIFQKADPNTVVKIIKDIDFIGRVARAAGIHMLFGSQSMEGTMKKDVLDQFQLRIALRCAESVSIDILGTKFASEIKQKYGFLYVRSGQDKSLQAQKRFKTPYFACQEDFRSQINMLADRAIEEGMPKREVIEYNEKTKHYIEEVDLDFEEAKDLCLSEGKELPNGIILLGRRMTYSDNKMPENIILGPDNNSHIMSVFSDTSDLVNFYKSLRRNIAHDETAKVFVNAQTEDLHYLCELDKEFTSEEELLASSEKMPIKSLISTFELAFEMRKESGRKDNPQYYILIGWDKANGFIIDKNPMIMDRMSSLLQVCGAYNMHFIFILTNCKGVDSKTNAACKYKICGKVSQDNSYDMLNNGLASRVDANLKNGYMYLNREGVVTRCKIYQSKLEREIQAKELKF